jgi:SAM-dependent methyltransferase
MPQPFDAIARDYDRDFTETATGRLQRAVVRACIERIGVPMGPVLEVNCGTGADAIWMAQKGNRVLATDISETMLSVAAQSAAQIQLETPIAFCRVDAGRLLIDLRLAGLGEESYPFIFSNFGGLNCLSPAALRSFGSDAAALLLPQGKMVVVMIGRFCWWETLYFLAKGRWRTAFRRLSKGPVEARLDAATTIPTWYYSPKEMQRLLPDFKLLHLEPVGIWLPPSYLDPLLGRFSGLWQRLERLCRWRGFAWASDHYIMVLEKVSD